MPAHQHFGLLPAYDFPQTRSIDGKLAGNMDHQHWKLLDVKSANFRAMPANILAINISKDAAEMVPACKKIEQFDIAQITGMPYLIGILQMVYYSRIHKTVRIGNEHYSFQRVKSMTSFPN